MLTFQQMVNKRGIAGISPYLPGLIKAAYRNFKRYRPIRKMH